MIAGSHEIHPRRYWSWWTQWKICLFLAFWFLLFFFFWSIAQSKLCVKPPRLTPSYHHIGVLCQGPIGGARHSHSGRMRSVFGAFAAIRGGKGLEFAVTSNGNTWARNDLLASCLLTPYNHVKSGLFSLVFAHRFCCVIRHGRSRKWKNQP